MDFHETSFGAVRVAIRKKKPGRYEECRKMSEGHQKKHFKLYLCPKFIMVV